MNETYIAYGVLIAACIGVIWSFASDAADSENALVCLCAAFFMGIGTLTATVSFTLLVFWSIGVLVK